MSTTDIHIAHHFADAEQQHSSAQLGMWLFLLTEVMLFGGLFTLYAVYRFLHPESFAVASRHLDIWLGTLNTVILIGSSLTMALAQQAIAGGSRARRKTTLFLALTILLGSVFLGVKAIEYRAKFQDDLIPGAHFHWEDAHAANTSGEHPSKGDAAPEVAAIELFFSLYFVMTGVHAAHMAIGMAVLGTLIVLAWRQALRPTVVEMTGLYWHFVDVVWIFLFPLLYLIGRHL